MREKTKLIIFSAPSGAGKTTLVHYLMSQVPDLAFSISATSRKPRPDEVNGRDYYFITTDEFQQKIRDEAFVEWEEVYENQYYGTLITEVERLRKQGKSVVFDVDVKGGLNIKRLYGNDALAIFIKPPSLKVLKQRLKNRSTENKESILFRLKRAKTELTFEPKFDAVVINNDLKTAKSEVVELVKRFFEKS